MDLPIPLPHLQQAESRDAQPQLPPAASSPLVKTPAPTFPLFRVLCSEIRVQVWRSALLVPRLITISSPSLHPNSAASSRPTYRSAETFHIHRSAPSPLLAVNTEARYEALKFYSATVAAAPRHAAREGGGGEGGAGRSEDVDAGAAGGWMDRLPYHVQHKSSTRGFYRRPGNDVVYLQGKFYDSRLFRGVSQVAREIVIPGLETARRKYPVVGPVRRLAVDEAFLSDERLFGRPEMSPVMVFLMRDLKGLEDFVVVRGEDAGMGVEEVKGKIESVRLKLVEQCRIWGFDWELRELEAWKMPVVRLMNLGELRRECGALGQ